MKFVNQAIRQFREAYGDYYMPCLVDCVACCRDAPPMTFLEWQLIPEDKRALVMVPHQASPCPFLEGTKCSIYDYRPTLCRVYGVPDTGQLSCRAGVRAHWIDVNRFNRLWGQYSAALSTDILSFDDHKTAWAQYMRGCKSFPKVMEGARIIQERYMRALKHE